MIEILFTANKKIHESVDLNFQFQQGAFTRASEHSSKLHTRSSPKTGEDCPYSLIIRPYVWAKKERGSGADKVSAYGNIHETSSEGGQRRTALDSCRLQHDTSGCKMLLLSTETVRVGYALR